MIHTHPKQQTAPFSFFRQKKKIPPDSSSPTHDPQKPRVLFVTNSLESGGVETHLLSLIKGLRSRGYFLAVASAGGALVKELDAMGVLHIYAPLDSKWPPRILASTRILKRAASRLKIDILHSHSRIASLACRLIGRSRKRRFVSSAHLDFRLDPLSRALGFWGEKTLAVSEDIRSYLIREYKLSYENIFLTVNGIDTERFCPLEKGTAAERTQKAESGEPQTQAPSTSDLIKTERAVRPSRNISLLHVSRIDRDRAYTAFLLCDLIPLLNEKYGLTLTILGGGELFEKLKKKVEALNRLHGNIITLPGAVEDIVPYLQSADLFVGVSRAALEAMSCAIPTILSGNSGYMGLFRQEALAEAAKSNFCCRGKTPATRSALLCDLEKLLKLPPTARAEIGKESRAVVLAHYSLDKMVSDYEHLYRSLKPLARQKYNKTAVLGYHGFGNLGDEAVLSQMIRALRKDDPEKGITVLSRHPRKTEDDFAVGAVSRTSPCALLALAYADTVYVGGGTLLQNKSSNRSLVYYCFLIGFAKLFGAKIAYFANGTDTYRGIWQPIVASLFRGRSAITLRDRTSYEEISRLLAKKPEKAPFCAQTADSGFLIKPCSETRLASLMAEYRLKSYVLIATNGCIRRKDYPALLAHAAHLVHEKGARPLLLLMHPEKDRPLAVKTAAAAKKRYGLSLSILSPSYRECAGLIEGAVFVLSSRLHALIFAAARGTPALAFGEEKCTRFAEELFGKPYALSVEKADEKTLAYAIYTLYEEKETLRQKIAEKAEPLKALAAQTPLLLTQALQPLSSPKKKRKEPARSTTADKRTQHRRIKTYKSKE